MGTERGENRNYWSSYREPVWAWEAVFDWTRTQPEQLIWWLGQALTSLRENRIYEVYAVPEIGYSSKVADPDSLFALITDRFRRESVIDLLYLSEYAVAGHPEYPISTSISYFTRDGAVVEDECKDLATLQVKTQPWLDEQTDGVYHRKPIVIQGVLFAHERPNFPTVNVSYNPKRLHLRVETYTDIWLPTVLGWNEPDYDGERRLPNTELSALNGSRLNRAIRRLADLTRHVGGIWHSEEGFARRTGEFNEHGAVL